MADKSDLHESEATVPQDEAGLTVPPTARPRALPEAGQVWAGKYLVESQLSRSGQGIVFKAYHQVLDRHAALKVPLAPLGPKEEAAWHEEARGLCDLAHPNIVRVMDAGTCDGVPYLATELIEGLPLSEYLQQRPPAPGQILGWMMQLLDALGAIHARGITHRDLKPGNILVRSDGRPILIDFGICTRTRPYDHEAQASSAGTAAWMAPEQARKEPSIDHRADIFAMGGILKFLLTGGSPYGDRASRDDYIQAARRNEVERAASGGAGLLRWGLARAANRAMQPRPARRYQNAARMSSALRRLRWARPVAGALAVGVALVVAAVAFRPGPAQPVGSPQPFRLGGPIASMPAGEVLNITYAHSPPPPAVPSARASLSLDVLVKRRQETGFRLLADGEAMASGVDDYLVVARPGTTGYLYVYQIDSSGNMCWLFPRNGHPFSGGLNPILPGQVVQIPSQDQGRALFLDDKVGVEHIYAVFSASPWPELETALGRAGAADVAKASLPASTPVLGQVTEPNRLRLRGVGGLRPTTQSAGLIPTSATRLHDGRQTPLRLGEQVLEAEGAFLVVERWFRHVSAE